MLEVGVIMYKSCEECICQLNGHMKCVTNNNCTCVYGPWNNWGPCSVTCGSGWIHRYREVIWNYGVDCDDTEDRKHCNAGPCPETTTPVLCPPWAEWDACDCEHPPYTRKRRRTIITKGPDCKPNVQSEGCKDLCNQTTTPVCQYTPSCVEPCDETCMGFRKPSLCLDNECDIECPCPAGQRYLNGICINETDCPCYDDDGNAVNVWDEVDPPDGDPCTRCVCEMDHSIQCYPRPLCCSWNPWGPWSDCSSSCGDGVRYRDRTYTGDDCAAVDGHSVKNCNEGPCPPDCVKNGNIYNNGDIISKCTCRVCFCTPSGEHCVANFDGNVDGQYSDWSNWSTCTRSCDGGIRTRTRLCDNPPPKCFGDTCVGEPVQMEDCNVNVACCEPGPWSAWGPCSKTCDGGTQTRGRSYLIPTDAPFCNELLPDEQDCLNLLCGSLCELSPWSIWSACSRSCGAGLIRRQRTVLSGNCTGVALIDETFCYEAECTCEPPHVWSNHSQCQVTCEQMAVQGNCSEMFAPGCICPAGTYFKDNKCVTLQECYRCLVDGTIYLPGNIWYPQDACEVCQCANGHVICESTLEIPTCEPDEEVSYEDGDCCPKCKHVQDTCSLKTRVSKLYNGDCETVQDVTYEVCSGTCGPSSSAPHLFTQAEASTLLELRDDNCKCCTGVLGGNQTVTLICSSGTTIPGYIPIFTGCECNSCLETTTTIP